MGGRDPFLAAGIAGSTPTGDGFRVAAAPSAPPPGVPTGETVTPDTAPLNLPPT